MKQLAQLQKQARKFEELNTEVIPVFREEKDWLVDIFFGVRLAVPNSVQARIAFFLHPLPCCV